MFLTGSQPPRREITTLPPGVAGDGHSLITRCAICITKSLVPVVQDTRPFKVPLDNITRRNGSIAFISELRDRL
jgi:hypothetical protein